MKKILFLTLAAGMMLLAGCKKDDGGIKPLEGNGYRIRSLSSNSVGNATYYTPSLSNGQLDILLEMGKDGDFCLEIDLPVSELGKTVDLAKPTGSTFPFTSKGPFDGGIILKRVSDWNISISSQTGRRTLYSGYNGPYFENASGTCTVECSEDMSRFETNGFSSKFYDDSELTDLTLTIDFYYKDDSCEVRYKGTIKAAPEKGESYVL